tara:strand:- start:1533 stop:1652 length:120 start_codon:yes stop_codon:yes gene_type:complete
LHGIKSVSLSYQSFFTMFVRYGGVEEGGTIGRNEEGRYD